MKLVRYSKILKSLEMREIVLLKSLPCRWGRCSFCSYIDDNSTDVDEIDRLNSEVLQKVTGEFKILEVINSGSCFEIPEKSLLAIQQTVARCGIEKLYFEAHWSYREKLPEFKRFFKAKTFFITGIETFDDYFRNQVLKKGVVFRDIDEIKRYFDSVCIMVGMLGQTKEMISRDVKILLENFDHGTINLFVENHTEIKPDFDLQRWFKQEYAWLNDVKKIDVLWKNTDFGVGTVLNE